MRIQRARANSKDIWQRSWREAERKKWGHLKGQNNLEPITQSTRWDPSTPPYSPTYSSHDVILQQVAMLSYITAHRPGETAGDKPDECFSALKILDGRIIHTLYTNRLVSKNLSPWILQRTPEQHNQSATINSWNVFMQLKFSTGKPIDWQHS